MCPLGVRSPFFLPPRVPLLLACCSPRVLFRATGWSRYLESDRSQMSTLLRRCCSTCETLSNGEHIHRLSSSKTTRGSCGQQHATIIYLTQDYNNTRWRPLFEPFRKSQYPFDTNTLLRLTANFLLPRHRLFSIFGLCLFSIFGLCRSLFCPTRGHRRGSGGPTPASPSDSPPNDSRGGIVVSVHSEGPDSTPAAGNRWGRPREAAGGTRRTTMRDAVAELLSNLSARCRRARGKGRSADGCARKRERVREKAKRRHSSGQ